MMLLRTEEIIYNPHCRLKLSIIDRRISCLLPITIGKTHREAEGINLEFAFPHPWGHVGDVRCVPMPIAG